MRKQSNWDRYCRRERLRDCFTGINFSKLRQAPPNDPEDEEEEDETPPDNEEDETGTLPPIVEQTIAALMTANPLLSRQVAADFLLHNRHGRQLLEDLVETTERTNPHDHDQRG